MIWVEMLQDLSLPALRHAVDHWLSEARGFPTIADMKQAAKEYTEANKVWDSVESHKLLEDKRTPKFLHRRGVKDTPEAKAARYRQLNKYKSLLGRHDERENW